MRALPAEARRTLTWDQGIEMSKHDELGPLLSDGVFFAYPSSPWQRGSNENTTNGLLRQYFPKGTDLTTLHSAEHLQAVEERLNTRPRKTLGWLTPAEVFTANLASSNG